MVAGQHLCVCVSGCVCVRACFLFFRSDLILRRRYERCIGWWCRYVAPEILEHKIHGVAVDMYVVLLYCWPQSLASVAVCVVDQRAARPRPSASNHDTTPAVGESEADLVCLWVVACVRACVCADGWVIFVLMCVFRMYVCVRARARVCVCVCGLNQLACVPLLQVVARRRALRPAVWLAAVPAPPSAPTLRNYQARGLHVFRAEVAGGVPRGEGPHLQLPNPRRGQAHDCRADAGPPVVVGRGSAGDNVRPHAATASSRLSELECRFVRVVAIVSFVRPVVRSLVHGFVISFVSSLARLCCTRRASTAALSRVVDMTHCSHDDTGHDACIVNTSDTYMIGGPWVGVCCGIIACVPACMLA